MDYHLNQEDRRTLCELIWCYLEYEGYESLGYQKDSRIHYATDGILTRVMAAVWHTGIISEMDWLMTRFFLSHYWHHELLDSLVRPEDDDYEPHYKKTGKNFSKMTMDKVYGPLEPHK